LIYGSHGKPGSGRYLRSLVSKVDGLIIMARSIDDEYLAWLQRDDVPLVLLSRPMDEIPCDTVTIDNQGGAESAAAHLIAHGHRLIALISGPEDSPANIERLLGYSKALQDAQLSIPDKLTFCGNFQYESGREAMAQILRADPKPSAVLVANDEMALGALETARQQGISVPEELAVIGFDDIPGAALVHPSLTTVRQPMDQLGRRAFKLLYDRFRDAGSFPGRNEILPTQLVVRQTCGCIN
jgi:LacI family transcriptional regulator